MRLDGGDVFWSLGGAGALGEHPLPDFVEQANAYLDRLEPGVEEVILKFLVKSDGPGRVKIRIEENGVEYSVIRTQSWENPLDNTVRLDRTFQLDFGDVERITLDPFSGPNNSSLSLSAVRADLGGEFEPERLLGDFDSHDGKEFATISGDYSLAQELMIEKKTTAKPIRCAGVTGVFQAEAEADLYLEIRDDAGSSPSSGPPLAKSNLSIAPPGKEENGRWAFARFEAPVDLSPETAYWIVVKGIRGQARLGLGPLADEQPDKYLRGARVNRGGQVWKGLSRPYAPPTSALLRLVYLPEIDNQSAAVEIAVEKSSQRIDPKPEAQAVSLALPEGRGAGKSEIVIKSHARGTLSIANVIQEHRPRQNRET